MGTGATAAGDEESRLTARPEGRRLLAAALVSASAIPLFGLQEHLIMQAVIFVSFLWELGYRGWGPHSRCRSPY